MIYSAHAVPRIKKLIWEVSGVTKTELVEFVRENAQLKRSDAVAAVNAVVAGISGALSQGSKVQLVGFGTFEVRQRSARTGRNPQDPTKTVHIPAKKVPVFKAGKLLRSAVDTKPSAKSSAKSKSGAKGGKK
ncbi:DNA-binding protein HU [Jonquetella anthropi E3_33 E1]|nr:DNA-binding protein HU [Jonquetella anthropi E3_33 E1]